MKKIQKICKKIPRITEILKVVNLRTKIYYCLKNKAKSKRFIIVKYNYK